MDPRHQWRPESAEIPTQPGVYRFWDATDRVIYVGKAKNLRHRVSSYFTSRGHPHPRTELMLSTARRVDWVVVATEDESLLLEHTWIREFDPRFNVLFRDDKSYPFLAVTVADQIPRVTVMRGKRKRGVRYFGPYVNTRAIRETVDYLQKVYPVRSCSDGTLNRHQRLGRPCLLGDIGKCRAPCLGGELLARHQEDARSLVSFLASRPDDHIAAREDAMRQASARLDFERAARIRDEVAALRAALGKNTVVLGARVNIDLVGIGGDEFSFCAVVFHVRGGRIRGQRTFLVDRDGDRANEDMLGDLLTALYVTSDVELGLADAGDLPPARECLVAARPSVSDSVERLVSASRGTRFRVRVPQRGAQRDLLDTVEENARKALQLHTLKRSSDLISRSAALNELAAVLELAEVPLRIECIDISHHGAEATAASVVVFEDGAPRKGDYRNYSLADSADDVAAIRTVVRKRYGSVASTQSKGGFRYDTGLLVVDGGRPQVEAARQELDGLGRPELPVVGLAKRLEEVWVPGHEYPVVFSRRSEALYLLQRLRDEAHRWAITHHRRRARARLTSSALDGISGVGPARRRQLLEHFGSLGAIAEASLDDLSGVPGIGPATARDIKNHLS